jgi:hypothetical protein
MDEILTRVQALGQAVLGAAFLYFASQLFHGPKDLAKLAKTTFQNVLVRVLTAIIGFVAVGALIVIWTGV